jgi:hypothetical protein
MAEARRGYQSYLLRLWQVDVDGELVWRASLESPHTGEQVSFPDAGRLLAFLDVRTTESSVRKTALPDGDADGWEDLLGGDVG